MLKWNISRIHIRLLLLFMNSNMKKIFVAVSVDSWKREKDLNPIKVNIIIICFPQPKFWVSIKIKFFSPIIICAYNSLMQYFGPCRQSQITVMNWWNRKNCEISLWINIIFLTVRTWIGRPSWTEFSETNSAYFTDDITFSFNTLKYKSQIHVYKTDALNFIA